jgi:alpha-tubulin suppressor-like RCC1 family protein
MAWGRDNYGQLGDNSLIDRSTLSGEGEGGVGFFTGVIALCWNCHSMGLKSDGTAGLGNNLYGQIGDGMTTNRLTPFPVLSNVSVISAGAAHSLALVPDVITGRDTVYSWGLNSSGQLGDGSYNNSASPVKVQLPIMELF